MDAVFDDEHVFFSTHALAVRQAIEKLKLKHMRKFMAVQALIVLLCVVVASTAAVVIVGFERKMRSAIDDLERYSNQLRASDARWRILFDDYPDPVFLLSQGGGIIDMNKAAEDVAGKKVGLNVLSLFDQDTDEFVARCMKIGRGGEIRQSGNADSVVASMRQANGESVLVNVTALPTTMDGKACVIMVIRDITQQMKAKRDMVQNLLHEAKEKQDR